MMCRVRCQNEHRIPRRFSGACESPNFQLRNILSSNNSWLGHPLADETACLPSTNNGVFKLLNRFLSLLLFTQCMGQDPHVQNVPDLPILVRKHLEHKKFPQNQRLNIPPTKNSETFCDHDSTTNNPRDQPFQRTYR
jgi:hypothetical protein